MSLSDVSSPPLRIELRRSRVLLLTLIVLAALAMWALLLSAAPRWSLIAVPLLLLAAWPRRPVHGWREVVLRGDGTAVGLDAAGEEQEITAHLLQRRGILTVLTLEAEGRRHPHVFTPETLASEQRRRLGLWFDRHGPAIVELKVATHV